MAKKGRNHRKRQGAKKKGREQSKKAGSKTKRQGKSPFYFKLETTLCTLGIHCVLNIFIKILS